MKILREDETLFLFEWVKNWYPTSKNPKIAIVLMNRKDWSDFYHSQPKQSMKEIGEKAKKELLERFPEIKELLEKIEKLPKEDQKRLLEKVSPHNFFTGMPANADPYEYFMNEQCGVMYSHEEEKELEKTGVLPNPIWKQFPDCDFVILISDFFNEQQTKILKQLSQESGIPFSKLRESQIYDTIFHELIHVIEYCNNQKIFESNDRRENLKITSPITRKWFEI
jgi:hypothetical protein